MKQLIFLTLLIFTFSVCWGKKDQLTITKDKVELVITAKTTKNQLKKFQKTLKEEANIDFIFKDIIVNSKKQISVITIEVNSNDGVKGSGRLLTSNIYNVGFVRNYHPRTNSEIPSEKEALFIGNISEKKIKLE